MAKILLVTMQFGAVYNQGSEKHVGNLAASLLELGHVPTILAGDPENAFGRASDFCEVPSGLEGVAQYLCPSLGWMSVWGAPVDTYIHFLRQHSFDVVHLFNPGHIGVNVIYAAKELGIKVVVSFMDGWWFCPRFTLYSFKRGTCSGMCSPDECMKCIAEDDERFYVKFARGFGRWGIRSMFRVNAGSGKHYREWRKRVEGLHGALDAVDECIALSRSGQKMIKHHYRVDAHYVPVGLHKDWFSPGREKACDSRKVVIGFAGALIPEKGLPVLLEALEMLSWGDVVVKVAGKGSPRIVDRMLASSVDVLWEGAVPPEKMTDFMDSLDVLVVPSVWPENQPQVVLEALARDIPLIASDVPGIAELLQSPIGLFAAGSAQHLAETLKKWRAGEPWPQHTPPWTRSESAQASLKVMLAGL